MLKWLMLALEALPNWHLQMIVSGQHLNTHSDLSLAEIAKDRLPITCKVDLNMKGDTPLDITDALSCRDFGRAFVDLKPDLFICLGDRSEIIPAVISAVIHNIPVAHIHGGEQSLGAIDDSIRHAVTKLSSLHFVAAEEYRHRVIQMGEMPDRVHLTGGMGADAIHRMALPDRGEFEKKTGIGLSARNAIVTLHPETRHPEMTADLVDNLLSALTANPEFGLIITGPNEDAGSALIRERFQAFCAARPNAYYRESLGQELYYAALKLCDYCIGNSSSGVLEAPYFGIPTINIGDRQQGRLAAESIISVANDTAHIQQAIEQATSPTFLESLAAVEQNYGYGNSVEAILNVLESTDFTQLPLKGFYDLPFGRSLEQEGLSKS